MHFASLLLAVVGLWGDRSGIHPNSNPPVRWDYDTGLNIRWHTPTPTFSYSAPVVLKDRVVYLNDVDPEHPWPLLVGLDLATGKECWRVEIIPETIAKQPEIKQLWEATVRWRGEFFQRRAEKEPSPAALARLGLKPGTDLKKRLDKEQALDPAGPPGAPWTDPWKTLGKAGLSTDNWRNSGGSWFFGETFATPISDGDRVFIQLAWGVWAAFDRDGKQLWMHHLPSLANDDYCQTGRSPLIWRDRLVADLGDYVRAFDRASGKELWSFKRSSLKIGHHEMASHMVVTVAGTNYVYCNGYPPIAVRLDDGKPFKITGPTEKSPGHIVRTDPDRSDVLYLAGGGEHGGWEGKGKAAVVPPAAIRLVPGDADTLKAEVLWHGVEGKPYGSQVSWMICHKGRLYFRNLILDAATGKVLLGKTGAHNNPDQAVPGSTFTLAMAGNRLYGQGYAEHGSEKRTDDLGAIVNCEVYDLQGHALAVNRLRGLSGQAQFRLRNNLPNWFSYANNFTVAGDVILSRSCNEVICIGVPQPPAQLAAAAAPDLVQQMQASDPDRAKAGFIGLCALGPQARVVAPDLVKILRDNREPGRGDRDLIRARAKRALAAMGAGAEEALLAGIGDEAGYALAMQTAALMEDYDAATRIFAAGLLGGKAPQFMPWLPPYERGQELTTRDIIPEALAVRGWRSKAGAAVLLKELPKLEKEPARYNQFAYLIACGDPASLVPHLPALRKNMKAMLENRPYAALALGLMGHAAAEALPDLEAWRATPQLTPALVAQLDTTISKVKASR